MGGSKKKSLSQMMKSQELSSRKEERKKKDERGREEKKALRGNLPRTDSKEFLTELAKMKSVTPYMVASRYNVKISVAKDILEQLRARGLVQVVSGNNRIRVFQVAAA
ncbi:MAG: hypothetical protein QW057_04845 [Candidatus Bathyarchaeia archaeon]